jgi:hypothetical protein
MGARKDERKAGNGRATTKKREKRKEKGEKRKKISR